MPGAEAASASPPPEGRLGRFLFAPARPRTVAWLRAALAAACALAFLAPSTRPPLAGEATALLSLTTPYLCLCGALLACFALGVRPRAAGLALALLLAPLALLPARMQSRQVVLASLVALSLGSAPRGVAAPVWPLRLLQLQLTALYGVNAVAKTSRAFLSGDALVGMSRMLPNFLADLSDGALHVGPLAVPVALAAPLAVATEYFLATAFWVPRLRRVAAVVGIAFHLSLWPVLRIGLLDVASMFLYLSFLLPLEEEARA